MQIIFIFILFIKKHPSPALACWPRGIKSIQLDEAKALSKRVSIKLTKQPILKPARPFNQVSVPPPRREDEGRLTVALEWEAGCVGSSQQPAHSEGAKRVGMIYTV